MKKLTGLLFVLIVLSFTGCPNPDAPSDIPVTGVSLDKQTAGMVIDGTEQLTATVTPADATNQDVTWTSSDTAVAAVDTDGLVTGVAAGTATITVTTVEGGFTDTCEVTVSAAVAPITGTLDTTFNSVGYAMHNSAAGGNSHDSGLAIALDSNGKIMVAGGSYNLSLNSDMALWRYTISGGLDTTFDSDGYTIHNGAAGGTGVDAGAAITLDGNGKILVAGSSYNVSGNTDMVLWRYNSDGSLDNTFDTDGYVVSAGAAGGTDNDYGRAIILDGNGKVLVAGMSHNGTNEDMVIWRYTSSGALDTSFSGDGIVVHDNAAGGNSHDNGWAIALDSNGKVLIAGYSTNASLNQDMALWRYTGSGILDTTFNSVGYVVHNSAAGGNGGDWGRGIAFAANGKIIVTGYSDNGTSLDMVIWRYNNNGTLDTSFGSGGVVVYDSGNGDDYGYAIALDSNGKILVTGTSYNASGNIDMVVWRYNSNGSLDTSFGSNGFVVYDSGNGDDYGHDLTLDGSGKILVAGPSTNVSGDFDMTIWRYK